jgi:sugar/nucleoside kinase (ribokinase family)
MILVLGGVGVDTIVRVPTLAVPPGDSVAVPPVYDYVAHSGNGVALGFHALGLPTTFVDFLGDDPAGRLVRARYAEVGLDFVALPAPRGTPRSVNLVDDEGRRFSFYDGRHPAGTELPEEAWGPLVARASHVHVAAQHSARAFAAARARGITTSTDVHAWDGVGYWAVGLAYAADIVFLSAAAAPEKIDDIMRAIVERGRARVVVATEGALGSRVLQRDGIIGRFPAVAPERPVVDSNGAGDAYSTAFMSRWLDGRPVAECALAGAVSGAYACGAVGTHEELIAGPALDAAIARAAVSERWRSGRV